MSTVVISGGSSGIGLAACESFSTRGWRVINISRRPCDISGVTNIHCDLEKEARLPRLLAEKVVESVGFSGRLCIVHNAGEFMHDSVDDLNLDYLSRAFRLMVLAPSIITKALSDFLGNGSSIVYVGSTLSEMGVAGSFSYVTIKHAVVGMMRAAQQDLSGRGVHSCCICPGLTSTEMLPLNFENAAEFARKRVSMRRLLHPKEIADLIAFASENPSINGAVLHANLGQIQR